LERIQLDSLGLDKPAAQLYVVLPSQPGQARRDTPVRVFPKSSTANAEISAAAATSFEASPTSQSICRRPQTCLFQWVKSGGMLILLAGIDTGSTCITGAHVQNQLG